MLFKNERKTFPALQLVVALLAFALVMGACDDGETGGSGTVPETTINYQSGEDALTWGLSDSADVKTLGLTPGIDTTEINLNWYSTGAPAGKNARVRFARGTFANAAELLTATGSSEQASDGFSHHKATITGLLADTAYQYSVSTNNIDWSEMYDFKTPATGSFKFAVIADAQLTDATRTGSSTNGLVDTDSRYPKNTVTTAAGWLETMEKIVAANVSFIVSAGDQVDLTSNGWEGEYDYLFAPAGMRNLPLAPTSGNHDAHAPYIYHYNIPNRQTFDGTGGVAAESSTNATGRNYYYLYNNILFVVLDTAPYPNSTVEAQPYVQRFDETLKRATAAHSGYDWLIVVHHKSTASVGDHIADRDIQYYVEAGFETVMSKYNVDFVLAGHDHVYARSYPLSGRDNGLVSVPNKDDFPVSARNSDGWISDNWTNPDGPIYLTFTTASGLKYYSVSSDPTYDYFKNWGSITNTSVYVKDNVYYPYLGDIKYEGASEYSTGLGSVDYVGTPTEAGLLPVSNAAYVQPYIPSYCIVTVTGKSITFATYPISDVINTGTAPFPGDRDTTTGYTYSASTPYDSITVTK